MVQYPIILANAQKNTVFFLINALLLKKT